MSCVLGFIQIASLVPKAGHRIAAVDFYYDINFINILADSTA